MKVSGRTFRLQWDLHAWSGIVASLFLVVIFYGGVFALFHQELSLWQEPRIHLAAPEGSVVDLDALAARVEAITPLPRASRLTMGAIAGSRFVRVAAAARGDPDRIVMVDPVAGTSVAPRSRLADELYALHFLDRLPGGRELSGVLAVGLLVAIVSGFVIHLKDLRRQWWRFRPALRLRFSMSDAHKVLGIFGLPFVLAIGWSGAVLGVFGIVGDGLGRIVPAREVDADRGTRPPEPAQRDAAMLSFAALVDHARTAIPGASGPPSYVDVQFYRDEACSVRVFFRGEALGERRYAIVRGVDGAVLETSGKPAPPVRAFEGVLDELHFARFGGLLLKLLYALLSFGVCAVIVTGNLVWIERRDPMRTRLGNRVLERLTAGITGGLVAGSAVYPLANRILPTEIPRRADVELGLFFTAWLFIAVVAFVPRWSARGVTRGALRAATVMFLGTVALDVAMYGRVTFSALSGGSPGVLVVELLWLALGLGCAAGAWSRVARVSVARRSAEA